MKLAAVTVFSLAQFTMLVATDSLLCQNPIPLTGDLNPGLHAPDIVDIDHASQHQINQMAEALACLKVVLQHMENNPMPAWASAAEFKEMKESIKAICGAFRSGNHYMGTYPPAQWPPTANPAPVASTDSETSDGRNTAEPNNNVTWDRGEFTGSSGGFSPMRPPHAPTQDVDLRKFQLGCTLFVELNRCTQVDPGAAGPAPGPGPAPPGPANQTWSRAVNNVRAYTNSARIARYIYENSAALNVSDRNAAAAHFSDRTENATQAWVRLQKVRKANPACTGFEDNPTKNW